MIESIQSKYAKTYDPHFSTPPGVYVETSYSVLTKKYFSNSVHIFAIGWALSVLSLFNLMYGAFSGVFLLIKDGLGSALFISVLFFSYYSIDLSRDFRRDKTFNYGYTRLTIVATFVNAIYIVFQFLEIIHEIVEGLNENENDVNDTKHFDPNYLYIGTRIIWIRIALLLILIFWTLKDVSLTKKIEDIIEQKFPNYERFTESDEDKSDHHMIKYDHTLRNCSLLYFSLKILVIYELLGYWSTLWEIQVAYHLGFIQNFAIVARSWIWLVLSMGPFLQSWYILLQKNSPRDWLLETKIQNELNYIPGVVAVSKMNIWTVEGMQQVCNLKIKILESNYDEIQRNIKTLLSSHFTRESDLTIELEKAGVDT